MDISSPAALETAFEATWNTHSSALSSTPPGEHAGNAVLVGALKKLIANRIKYSAGHSSQSKEEQLVRLLL